MWQKSHIIHVCPSKFFSMRVLPKVKGRYYDIKKNCLAYCIPGNNNDYTMKYLFTFLYFGRITQFAIFPEPFWIASIYSYCYTDVRYLISLAVTIIQPTHESFRLLMSWLEWITWNIIFRGRLVYLQVSVSINKQKSLLIYLYLNSDFFFVLCSFKVLLFGHLNPMAHASIL